MQLLVRTRLARHLSHCLTAFNFRSSWLLKAHPSFLLVRPQAKSCYGNGKASVSSNKYSHLSIEKPLNKSYNLSQIYKYGWTDERTLNQKQNIRDKTSCLYRHGGGKSSPCVNTKSKRMNKNKSSLVPVGSTEAPFCLIQVYHLKVYLDVISR